MKFSKLASYFDKIERTASRLEITRLLSSLFGHLSTRDIDKTIYLLEGRIAPLYQALEFGMAEKMVIRSINDALNLEGQVFEKEYKKIGDLGKTVENFKKQIMSLEQKDLSIQQVYDELYKLAKEGGAGSQDKKISILSRLISCLDPVSAKYLVRIPLGIMRLGFSDMTVLDAFSWMIRGDKSLRPIIEKAYHVRPDLGYIGGLLKDKGIEALEKIQPTLFTPIIMMKAERLSSGAEIIDKIGVCSVEPKYDGFRLQIHYKKNSGEVRLYSRSLDDVSPMYPDIIEGIKKEIRANDVILEGEAIGFDPQSGSFLPFQETVQRKRKYDIEEKAKQVPLKLFAFDLLYLDGKNYLTVEFKSRRINLEKVVKMGRETDRNTIIIADNKIIDEAKNLELEFDDAVSKGLEGVLAKKLDGIYQPGARGWNWIKFKRSYSSKIQDSIDCLVMGYDFGKGKRADFGIGAFLAGVYDQKKDKFVTVAKIGTGLVDEEWREMKRRCNKYKSGSKPASYEIDKQMGVDMWITPSTVVEIKADEITRSPVHTAGRIMKQSKTGHAFEVERAGFALRFPRLVRFRDDKRVQDVTTLEELEKMYKSRLHEL